MDRPSIEKRKVHSMTSNLTVEHATLIDGNGGAPVADATVTIEAGRIVYAGPHRDAPTGPDTEVRDYRGAFLIPGLMDANIHLVSARTPDTLLEYEGRYDQLALEAAQLALKYGLTTVFDTWGPAAPLIRARDRINNGNSVGSRVFCAGNILGLAGPLSEDFFRSGSTFEPETKERINRIWERGCGPNLISLTVDGLADAVRAYIADTDVDFIKYAASDHRVEGYLLFSESAQRAIVQVCHEAGLRVQAHTTTVESLRIEVESGNDLLQHPAITGPTPMPERLMAEIVDRQLPCMTLMLTEQYLAWLGRSTQQVAMRRKVADQNIRELIRRGARVLLTTDAFAYGPRVKNHAGFRPGLLDDSVPGMPTQIGNAHLLWIEAAWERGLSPMEILRSATTYTAQAYGRSELYGTIEAGKVADLVVLDRDPLTDPAHYRAIRDVIKDGQIVDRDKLGRDLLLADDPVVAGK